MRPLTAATPILAATALLGAPASAHHSQSMFDTSQEILVKGTVERFDWVNPHMYLIEDPTYLTGPATLTQQWDHRPDLEFSQNVGACDPEVAARYREHVPQ